MKLFKKHPSVLPGFGPTMGYTLLYLSLVVLIPLSSLVFKTAGLSWNDFLEAVAAPRVLASYRITFGAALAAAGINAVFGVLIGASMPDQCNRRSRFPERSGRRVWCDFRGK